MGVRFIRCHGCNGTGKYIPPTSPTSPSSPPPEKPKLEETPAIPIPDELVPIELQKAREAAEDERARLLKLRAVLGDPTRKLREMEKAVSELERQARCQPKYREYLSNLALESYTKKLTKWEEQMEKWLAIERPHRLVLAGSRCPHCQGEGRLMQTYS